MTSARSGFISLFIHETHFHPISTFSLLPFAFLLFLSYAHILSGIHITQNAMVGGGCPLGNKIKNEDLEGKNLKGKEKLHKHI